jgi:5-methylcytosine-specific restriction endonuclease McrA
LKIGETKLLNARAKKLAIFLAHGECCWICGEPILYKDAEVEHLIPDSFQNKPDELAEALKYHELDSDFDLQDYDNLRTAHTRCNRKKGARNVNTMAVTQELRAGKKAARKARTFVEDRSNKRVVELAEGLIELAEERGFSQKAIILLQDFIIVCENTLGKLRTPENKATPIKWISGQLVRGPYGQGIYIGSEDIRYSPCPACGVHMWNGARCAWCGNIDD